MLYQLVIDSELALAPWAAGGAGDITYLRQDNAAKTMTVAIPDGDTASQYEVSLGSGIQYQPLSRASLTGTSLTFGVGNRNLPSYTVQVRKVGTTAVASNQAAFIYITEAYRGGQVRVKIAGDSRVVGYNTTTDPIALLRTLLGDSGFNYYQNYGQSGKNASQVLALRPIFDAGVDLAFNNYIWLMCGVNGVYNPDALESLEQAKASTAALYCGCVAAGYLVIASTETHIRIDAASNIQPYVTALNDFIRANYQSWGCVELTDLANDANLASDDSLSDTVHWTNATNQYVMERVADKINAIEAVIGGPQGDNLTTTSISAPTFNPSPAIVGASTTLSTSVHMAAGKTLASVRFRNGGTDLGAASGSGNNYSLATVFSTAGSKQITAVVTDTAGTPTTSAASALQVNAGAVALTAATFLVRGAATTSGSNAASGGGFNSSFADLSVGFGPGSGLRGVVEFDYDPAFGDNIFAYGLGARPGDYGTAYLGVRTTDPNAGWNGNIASSKYPLTRPGEYVRRCGIAAHAGISRRPGVAAPSLSLTSKEMTLLILPTISLRFLATLQGPSATPPTMQPTRCRKAGVKGPPLTLSLSLLLLCPPLPLTGTNTRRA